MFFLNFKKIFLEWCIENALLVVAYTARKRRGGNKLKVEIMLNAVLYYIVLRKEKKEEKDYFVS